MKIRDSEKKLIDSMGINISQLSIKIDNFELNYIKTGTGKPILLIHGINFGWGEWYKTIPCLAKHYTVYALDLPGAGNSSSIDFSNINIASLYFQLIEKFIKNLQLTNLTVIGHSIGGWVALKLGTEQNLNINKIVVTNSLGFSDYLVWKQRLLAFKNIAKFLSATVMKPDKKNITSFLKSVFYNKQKLTPELVDYYLEAVSASKLNHPFFLINQIIKPFKIKPEFVLINSLSKILVPVKIISCENDPLLRLSYNKINFERIPHQINYTIPKSGHVPQIESSEIFNNIILSFLLK